ncbi:mRNA N(3)-methylcytidine methyltransferase METTL8 isoform X2 [Sceloporus undulatus]|uniref:mRNA N(3)-methylcytidine methyltransferase METTL8 isoform X2 n=1 Tax=Sceloporus undulatus TaxID=8520 RepID=UPI001C4A920B|nr:mRNA N(3)-methylcytidine methyltransferase METTL8 isoform X2 [Sceloporus undulatus]
MKDIRETFPAVQSFKRREIDAKSCLSARPYGARGHSGTLLHHPILLQSAELVADILEAAAEYLVILVTYKYEREASKYWDQFYKTHKNNFFKDRNWLFLEFPEILPKRKYDDYIKMDTSIEKNSHLTLTRIHEDNCLCENNSLVKGSSVQGSNISSCHHYSGDDHHSVKCFGKQFPGSNAIYRILEVGCGVGNSVIPILKAVCHIPGVFLYCCDFASGAVELIKSHSSFDSSRCFAFVHDLCDNASPYPFPDESLDVILLVFVLSSIHPDRIQGIVNRLAKLLKPGGMMLFRDYGRYDASQLRFKKGCCLSENFYVRGDGTRAYFFTKGVLHP